jgi:uncharacterized protein (DUF111 family)
MEHPGMLILAQADHLTGEEIGFAIDQIMSEGANNVYYFPGITKNGRPGCVLLIDINKDEEGKWSRLLAEHLGIFGFHRIQTTHYCAGCHVQSRTVTIRKRQNALEAEVRFKGMEGGSASARVEHVDAARLCKQARHELDTTIPLATMKARLQSAFRSDAKDPITINV